jgi:hypothetical protein
MPSKISPGSRELHCTSEAISSCTSKHSERLDPRLLCHPQPLDPFTCPGGRTEAQVSRNSLYVIETQTSRPDSVVWATETDEMPVSGIGESDHSFYGMATMRQIRRTYNELLSVTIPPPITPEHSGHSEVYRETRIFSNQVDEVTPTPPIVLTPTQSTPNPSALASLVAVIRAYSVHDPIDQEYHNARPLKTRYLTASGRDALKWPSGIAGPRELIGTKVFLRVPGFSQYQDSSVPVLIDDTGGLLRHRVEETGRLHLELRFPTTEEAKKFGVKEMLVYLDKPWTPVKSKSTKNTP